jgi:hypothetical protein
VDLREKKGQVRYDRGRLGLFIVYFNARNRLPVLEPEMGEHA